jgi:hypothetical protein
MKLKAFLIRAWMPYLASLIGTSLLLAIGFSLSSGVVEGLVATAGAIFLVAVPVTVVLGMPVAFWGWRLQQQRCIPLTHAGSAAIGALAGFVIHTTLLLALGAWMAFPQIMLFTLLCGGGYGLVFGLLFSLSGGLELPKSDEARLPQ